MLALAVLAAVVVEQRSSAPRGLPAGDTRLVVHERTVGPHVWSDGYRSFLTVIAPNGGVAKSENSGTGVWRQSVVPGRYRIASTQRQCDPGCANLMEPSDQCTRDLAVTGAATEVTITVREGRGCTIDAAA